MELKTTVSQYQSQNPQYERKDSSMYGDKTWITTSAVLKKVQEFTNNCLCKILNVRWSDTISNNLVWKKTKQLLVEENNNCNSNNNNNNNNNSNNNDGNSCNFVSRMTRMFCLHKTILIF
ncbi:unnamed protein product [Schistosoma curassoni]|uniref:Myb domain-containing protein n=1 Tax=Schistosoma curassoni TaxID=6186 RepID=A0A183KE88_9TREM|nr:unnamed protein product [Schistosoma curassoni]